MKKAIVTFFFAMYWATGASQITGNPFKWMNWKDVPDPIRAKLSSIRGTTLGYKEELSALEIISGCTAANEAFKNATPNYGYLSLLDMDGDDKMEYVYVAQGMQCCGTGGCSVMVWTEGIGLRIDLLLKQAKDIKWSTKGIIHEKVLYRFDKVDD